MNRHHFGLCLPDALPFKLLPRITAGTWPIPAGGLCLLSARDKLGDNPRLASDAYASWRSGLDSNQRLTRFCRPPLFLLSYADQIAGLSRLSCVTDFRIVMAFPFNVLNHHTPRLFRGVTKERKRSRPETGLVHPQGCEPRRRREQRTKPAPDGCVLVSCDCGQSPYEQFPGGRAFYIWFSPKYPEP